MKNQDQLKILSRILDITPEELQKRANHFEEHFVKDWYDNYDYYVDNNNFSFYDDPNYVYATVNFFKNSANGIRATKKYFDSIRYVPEKILDFGAGIGMTTMLLCELFPNSRVYYFNISENQKNIANQLCSSYPNFICVTEEEYKKEMFDTIFTLEVLEHFSNPCEIEEELRRRMNKYLIDSNSFPIYGNGHFKTYLIENINREQKNARRFFCKYLKKHYELEFTGWDARPRIWRKIST